MAGGGRVGVCARERLIVYARACDEMIVSLCLCKRSGRLRDDAP